MPWKGEGKNEKMKTLILNWNDLYSGKALGAFQDQKLKVCFGNGAAFFFFVWFLTDKNFTDFEQLKPVLGGFPSLIPVVMSFVVENQLSQWVQCQLLSKELHCPTTLLDFITSLSRRRN